MIGVQLGLLLGALDGIRTMADVPSDGEGVVTTDSACEERQVSVAQK